MIELTDMFAVVDIQGKQYRVVAGDVLEVERMAGEVGAAVTFDRVLLLGDEKASNIGTPTVKGAVVTAKILAQEKGDKVEIRRYKSKVRYRRSRGFRPLLTKLEIVSVA